MGNSEGEGFLHGWMAIQRLIHSKGGDFHSAPTDQFLEPPGQLQVAMVVEEPLVARQKP